MDLQGRQMEFRAGVFDEVAVRVRSVGGLVGVPGRKRGASGSARLMNCKGVNGEPFVDGLDFSDCGLAPFGVDRENEGIWPFGSGVRGGSGGVASGSGASSRVVELIHFSSLPPARGGESDRRRKLSAK